MPVSFLTIFVFFLVSGSSCPSEVYQVYLFFCRLFCCLFLLPVIIPSFSMPMLFPVCKWSLSPLSHLPVCKLSSSWWYMPTFSHSVLLSPRLDVSLSHGVSSRPFSQGFHTSLRSALETVSAPSLKSMPPFHSFLCFSVFLFPCWLFLCLKCISLDP